MMGDLHLEQFPIGSLKSLVCAKYEKGFRMSKPLAFYIYSLSFSSFTCMKVMKIQISVKYQFRVGTRILHVWLSLFPLYRFQHNGLTLLTNITETQSSNYKDFIRIVGEEKEKCCFFVSVFLPSAPFS